jgi:adenylate cyclase
MSSTTNTVGCEKLIKWLMGGATTVPSPDILLSGICERLVDVGVPLCRVGVLVRTLHPDALGRSFVWRPGKDVVVETLGFDLPQSDRFRQSPLAILYASGHEVRYRLDDPESKRFSFFDNLRAEGVTDYIGLPMHFTDGSLHATSWTSMEAGGFGDEHLFALRSILPPFARLAEIFALRRTAASLLDTYVGSRAGERIMAGQIRRGHAESMKAVIWLSDLRGFTALSDRLAADVIVDILNQYFDCQVPAIRKHGGEILKFMGDGLLAVFPISKDGANLGEVCGRALEASREAKTNVDAMRHPGRESIERFRFGVALHIGEILFGNIGGSSRLDFTCIGPSVNLAARLEKLAGKLGRTVIASSAFAGVLPNGWTDLGEFPIAGFSEPQRVFGISDEVG